MITEVKTAKYYEEEAYLISVKTTALKKSQVIKQLQSNQLYDIPLIMSIDMEMNLIESR